MWQSDNVRYLYYNLNYKMPNHKYSVIDAIGNTPLIEITKVGSSSGARIFAKLESANPTGSMKDRMAKTAIVNAEKRGWIKPGDTVVEYTAGTTGVSLACICAAL